MKVIKVNKDESLSWVEVADPVCEPGGVIIEIHASAVNRADLLQRAGKYPPPSGWPQWPGLEVAGVILEVGQDVDGSRWKVGDKVCALLGGGGYAEKVAVPAELLMPVPEGLSMAEAASLPEIFATAWLNLVNEAHLQAGETMFVHAGASGVGIAALQIAKSIGARTVTSVGGQTKVELMRELGVDRIVNHHEESVESVFDECLASDHPINVVLDCVGGKTLGENLSKLALEGRWVLIATLGGVTTELALRAVLTRRLRLIGSTLRSRSLEQKEGILSELVEQLWPQFESGQIKPVVHAVLPIEQADAAHQILKNRENRGKVVLTIRDGAD
ncbi:NAD(P)H-quinone oxidoreductase [Ruficoccus amylovorans]|uniref:NAD(P)H-quinone oxidoreductase n=1 Tax=Ruficoccus amylovorans TaxID=1804625 RepID=A0A842HI71_9BACT|nr:NAD(P)H-quinone oxidoreductase [Ruficoccus amylovorans]MBC2595860.1 NAD(P)H-quinone oxidoreductase [Ruficoccus amylovorans]